MLLSWFQSYFTGRQKIVVVINSGRHIIQSSMAYSRVLLVLFVLCVMLLDKTFSCHSVGHYASPDDTQLYRSYTPDLAQSTVHEMEEYVSGVKS